MPMSIILYTTDCPKCKILKQKLDEIGLSYDTNTNIKDMIDLGFTEAPMLNIDGEIMNFSNAMKYINEVYAN